uniref:Uncharacterized protein n=1 Tax=Arundo donax TaxID=35708 RepID=A0A0A8YC95_ARUDO
MENSNGNNDTEPIRMNYELFQAINIDHSYMVMIYDIPLLQHSYVAILTSD